MKSKKLIVLIASIAAAVVVIILLTTLFTVNGTPKLRYYDFNGKEIAAPTEGGIAPNDILKCINGKNAVFLSKTKLLDQINTTFPDWHAFAVTKYFPNVIEIHIVRCTAMLKLDVNGKEVYIDCFGYVMNAPASGKVIDATSAFKSTDAKNQNLGERFEFVVAENDVKLQYVLDALLATWQCNVEPSDLAALLGEDNVFHFDEDGNMLITPRSGGTIKILSPKTNLAERLIKAYGVYYNEYADLQSNDWVITVQENGTITTPNPDR